MPRITLEGFQCTRCGHTWVPRNGDEPPTVCPKCKSPYWDRERTKGRKKRKVEAG